MIQEALPLQVAVRDYIASCHTSVTCNRQRWSRLGHGLLLLDSNGHHRFPMHLLSLSRSI